MLEQVSAVVHGLFDSPQPRQEVCEAVMEISSATSAVLFEPVAGSDQLTCTAAAGLHSEVDETVVQRRSAAYEAMRTGKPILISKDVEARIGLIEVWIAAGRPSSLLYQPLLRGDTPLGVLAIGWASQVPTERPRTAVVALLAHEVAAVISRADTLDNLNEEAFSDELTGLPNRRSWERHLRQLGAADQPVAIAILDLDHFKQFNDTHGHPAGDRLLKETAARWRDELRTGDLLARIGGEEFGLLLIDCDVDAATEVVDRLRRCVTHNSTCSAGIAIQHPAETPQTTTERADAALYRAKTRGRDQARLAEDDHLPPRPAHRHTPSR